jgi:hypothetical protein
MRYDENHPHPTLSLKERAFKLFSLSFKERAGVRMVFALREPH